MTKFWDLLALIVPEYIPMAVIGAFVGFVASTKVLQDTNFLLLIILLSCVVAGFNTFNAIADQKIDQINKPQRPLVAKKITILQAKQLTVFFYAVALLIALTLGTLVLALTMVATVITILYSVKHFYLKKRFVIGNLVGAVFYGIICPLIGWAITSNLNPPIAIITTLFLLAIGLSFLKDFEDVVGDKKYEIATLPLKLGRYKSVASIILIATAAFAYLAYSIYIGALSEKYYLILIFYPLIFFNVYSYKNPANKVLTSHLFRTTVTIVLGFEITLALITFLPI